MEKWSGVSCSLIQIALISKPRKITYLTSAAIQPIVSLLHVPHTNEEVQFGNFPIIYSQSQKWNFCKKSLG